MKDWNKHLSFPLHKAEDHGIISALIVMTKLQRELAFLDEDGASEIVLNFQKKKWEISDKEILKQLDDLSLFDKATDFVRVNNVIAIAYIAHKLQIEVLWQRYLNFILPKYFLKVSCIKKIMDTLYCS